jgi:hypothetical protein
VNSLTISLVAFACIFVGTLLGIFLSSILPKHHLNDESKDAVKLGTGMIAMLAALVLGLLTASAKSNFDTMNSGLRKAGSRVIVLDRVMAHYGPETMEARHLLRHSVTAAIAYRWPEDKIRPAVVKSSVGGIDIEAVQDQLRQLSPRNDVQSRLQSRALQISDDIAEGRWFIVEQEGLSSLPKPFFVILVFWLTFIFASFGLFSPRNATVIIVLLVCALSAAGSLFLILELDTPFEGLIKVSSAPLYNALAHLGQ